MSEKFITFGIGGCGCTIAHQMSKHSTMQAVCIDSDATVLNSKSDTCTTILVGENRFEGMGTCGDYETACMVAKESQQVLREQLKECSLAIVVTGIGGGTGSAITPMLLQIAKSMSIPTMVYIVHPFSMEGGEKARISARAIQKIIDSSDAYCSFKNEELCGSLFSVSNSSFQEAIIESNNIIISGITMFWRMVTQASYICLDLATLLACVKKGRGQFHLLHSAADGEGRTQKALNAIINSNKGVNTYANNTAHALVGVFGGADLRLSEISDIVANLTSTLSPNTPIKLSTVIDEEMENTLELNVILFENWVDGYSVETPAYTKQIPQNTIHPTNRNDNTNVISTFNTTSSTISPSVYERFKGTKPLIYNGENLDEPTYLRKRISIS